MEQNNQREESCSTAKRGEKAPGTENGSFCILCFDIYELFAQMNCLFKTVPRRSQ